MNKKEEKTTLIREFGESRIVPTLKKLGFPLSISIQDKKELGIKITTRGDCDLESVCNAIDAPQNIKNLVSRFYLAKIGPGSASDVFLSYDTYSKLSEEDSSVIQEYFHKLDSLYTSTIETLCQEFNQFSTEKTLSKINSISPEDLIPKKIKKNYIITGGLDSIENWKAKIILLNNNRGDLKIVGDWSAVGYVLVSLDSGALIPVAREDEHHTGTDLLDYLIEKRQIKSENFYPIFNGTNYVYGDESQQISRSLKAFKIWRSLGGDNLNVTGTTLLNFSVTMDDYISLNGKVKNGDEIKNELLPIGARFIQNLEKLAVGFNSSRENKSVNEAKLYEIAYKLLKEMNDSFYGTIATTAEKGLAELAIAQAKNDLKKLEEIIFSHDGIKNVVHIKVKKWLEAEEKKSFREKDLAATFGDLALFNSQLIRLGMQY